MNSIYLVPQATVDGAVTGIWHAAACPDGIHSLLVVERWGSHADQDAFDALPGVLRLLPWQTTPPELVAAFAAPLRAAVPTLADLALAESDPVHETMRKLRPTYPALRW